ncbi:M56 family metallopeptidase [Aeoliella mucimassa]|uniref:Regulatory protein BlaR1 n=1 Tax=Aeoliella mucimassa TaxID=2527972 RepID=A0A518AR78_9BACT|nr:M56 family metallopeptidase [Aeoliella mucimassa]QDU57234.1 Regulatory protein BlaR1 [Aeoliella mucimassa]
MNGLQWFQVILSLVIQLTIVLGLAWGLERWTSSVLVKARVWSACFVSLLLMLMIGLLLPRLEWLHPWSSLGPTQLLAVATTEFVLGKCLLAIWLCGVGVMLTRWAIQFVRVRAFIRGCPEYSAEMNTRLKQHIPTEMAAPHHDQLLFLECPEELGPFCYQFHRPLIFLPPSLAHGNSTELEHVLRHELTHLDTQHPMQQFAQKLAQVLFWFHPLVWISGRRCSLVREFVCDEAASSDAESTASYLRTLLRLVENQTKSPAGGLMFGRSQSELKLRARRLVLEQRTPPYSGYWAPALVLLGAMIAAQVWLPTNPLSPHHSQYSPWPTWTASVAHAFGVSLKDFETFDRDLRVDELIEAQESP